METIEHQPGAELKKVEPITASDLGLWIKSGTWIDNPAVAQELIKRGVAALVGYDTQMVSGNEFLQAGEYIQTVFNIVAPELILYEFAPLSDDFPLSRSFIFAPVEARLEMEEISKLYHSDEVNVEQCRIELDSPAVYAHIDTVNLTYQKGKKVHARHACLEDEKTGIVYGLGTNDMKASIVALMLSASLLERQGKKHPVYVFGTDEEFAGLNGGKRLLQCFKSNSLTLDTEPIANIHGAYFNSILGSTTVNLFCNAQPDFNKMRRLLAAQLDDIVRPQFAYRGGELILSGLNEHFRNSEELEKTLIAVAASCVTFDRDEVLISKAPNHYSPLSVRSMSIITSALQRYTTLARQPRSISMLTDARALLLGEKFHRNVRIFHNFSNMTAIAYPNQKEVANVGIAEAGGGRHSISEGYIPEQTRQMGFVYADIIGNL